MPLTHALALMRYALIDASGRGLHDIWGLHSVRAEALLSLAVVAVFAAALPAISIRAFSRSAIGCAACRVGEPPSERPPDRHRGAGREEAHLRHIFYIQRRGRASAVRVSPAGPLQAPRAAPR